MRTGQRNAPPGRECWSTVSCCVGNKKPGGGDTLEPRTLPYRLLYGLRDFSLLNLSILYVDCLD